MRSGNILNQRHARRLMSTSAPKPSWRNFSEVMADNKENAQVGAHLTAIFVFASGGMLICGQMIGEYNSYKSVIATVNEKLLNEKEQRLRDQQNEKEQRLKDQQITDEKLIKETELRLKDQQITDEKLKLSEEKLKNEKEQRLKDQQITDEKLKLSEEKLKNAERRLQKGYLW